MGPYPSTLVKVAWAVSGLVLLGFLTLWILVLWVQSSSSIP